MGFWDLMHVINTFDDLQIDKNELRQVKTEKLLKFVEFWQND